MLGLPRIIKTDFFRISDGSDLMLIWCLQLLGEKSSRSFSSDNPEEQSWWKNPIETYAKRVSDFISSDDKKWHFYWNVWMNWMHVQSKNFQIENNYVDVRKFSLWFPMDIFYRNLGRQQKDITTRRNPNWIIVTSFINLGPSASCSFLDFVSNWTLP